MTAHPDRDESVPTAAWLAELYLADEASLVARLAAAAALDGAARARIGARAAGWVRAVRGGAARSGVIDSFLQEYGLSTEEGIILMRLSEALIRTPDFATAQALMRDKLSGGAWAAHSGKSPSALINGATAGLRLTAAWIGATGGRGAAGLAARLGDRALHAAVVRGMGIMADHFVLGSTIENALERGKVGDLHSFDMLGEGAMTAADAARYFDAYAHAVRTLAGGTDPADGVARSNGISVKLSALHPRYEYNRRAECVPALVEQVAALGLIAREAGIGLTLDAEEADRLECSLIIFEALLRDPRLAGWDGLGIVIQAYQRRAGAVIDAVAGLTADAGRRIAVRLVKGAYWDMEIKRAQELGLASYPVFTRKPHSDISYLACARMLLDAGPSIYPQFATHNAHTAAAIVEMAEPGLPMEFQRLHGMGEALHGEIGRATGIATRIYAPVGDHKDLLPYLVRRLLENGANSSFVNQLMNPAVAIDAIVADPVAVAQAQQFAPSEAIGAPRDRFGGSRQSAAGIDLTQAGVAARFDGSDPPVSVAAASLVGGQPLRGPERGVHNPADPAQQVGSVSEADAGAVVAAIDACAASGWGASASATRAACLRRAADAIEADMPRLMALSVAEAGKSWPDAVAELREAVDFCRYYADGAEGAGMAGRSPLGIVACISPWNFPLAIFIGQIAASLGAGNRVIAKPAPQTPLIAFEAVRILHHAGIPADALQLLLGGPDVGAALVGDPRVAGVVFTGSTATAHRIAEARIGAGRADSVLIAETGGINAMIVDSTALIEQAVRDAVASAFQSAGQRCSACRIVCVAEEIADAFTAMLAGAMAQLRVGDPARLATDVGPIIDDPARQAIAAYVERMRAAGRLIAEAPAATAPGHFVRPVAVAVDRVSAVEQEVFGPVLHVVRFAGDALDALIGEINALGYGLTLGVHSRIDGRVQDIAARAHVGNIYVNRNQIGAVVGVQPFGGEALSGTGPKAGGPHYMRRLSLADGSMSGRRPLGEGFSDAAASPPAARIDLAAMRNAQRRWAACDRGGAICQAGAALGFDPPAGAQPADLVLPGPTGEENRLSLHPRGLLLCLGDEADSDALPRQLLAALATGNAAIVVPPAGQDARAGDMFDTLARCGVPRDVARRIERLDLSAALAWDIDGALADGAARGGVAAALLARAGPILPLLSADDDIERFFHERVVTINTTAAGGNASLLAGG